jgi:hypothetical protein
MSCIERMKEENILERGILASIPMGIKGFVKPNGK